DVAVHRFMFNAVASVQRTKQKRLSAERDQPQIGLLNLRVPILTNFAHTADSLSLSLSLSFPLPTPPSLSSSLSVLSPSISHCISLLIILWIQLPVSDPACSAVFIIGSGPFSHVIRNRYSGPLRLVFFSMRLLS